MNMSKQKYIITLIILLFVGYVAYLIAATEWKKVEQEIGLSEEARINPLLAATLLLEEREITLNRVDDISLIFDGGKITLAKDYSLVIDEAVLTEVDLLEPAIVEWVKAGGNLVYVLSPRRKALDKIDDNKLLTTADLQVAEPEDPSRRHLVTEEPEANINLALKDYSLALNIPYHHYFTECTGESFAALELEYTLICDIAISEGFITFIPSLHPISNSSLKHLDHGEFLLWLVGNKRGLYYLPSSETLGWLGLIWNWSWQFIILLSLIFVFYMWHAAVRIGLPKTPMSTTKNLFADHIEAVGNFMITHNHHQTLKAALLKDLEYVMEKRNPKYKQLKVTEQAKLISQSTGKNSQEIEQLLTEPLPLDDNQRLHFIKLFKELRNSL